MAYGDFEIKVGDEVGVVRFTSYSRMSNPRFGTVSKINGYGHIFVRVKDEELRFDRRGHSYKDHWGPDLIHAAQLRARLAEENRRRVRADTVRKIEHSLRENWAGSDNWTGDNETIQTLKSLLADLESQVDNT